jgi:ankyrin repeat protein
MHYNNDMVNNLKVNNFLRYNNINKKDVNGDTLLINAAFMGKFKLVKLLLKKGADPNLGDDNYGYYPLHWSVIKNYIKITKLLVNHSTYSTNKIIYNYLLIDIINNNDLNRRIIKNKLFKIIKYKFKFKINPRYFIS